MKSIPDKSIDLKEVWEIPPRIDTEHPATFPIELCKRCIDACSNEKDVVFDPFCGSGTTCVAAKMLGRKYIGIDISEEYCEIARERLTQVSGNLFKTVIAEKENKPVVGKQDSLF